MRKRPPRERPADASGWLDVFLRAADAVDLKPLDLYTAAVVYKAFLDMCEREVVSI